MISAILADITTLRVDAIVNAANSALRGGGGVDGAIHRAAGPELLAALRRYDRCPPGDAVLTPGFRLPARWVIHAVGPIWHGGTANEDSLLRSAYQRSFDLAAGTGDVTSIAFPAISTGVYGFPRERAATIALDVLYDHESRFERVIACLFDRDSLAIYDRLLGERRAKGTGAE